MSADEIPRRGADASCTLIVPLAHSSHLRDLAGFQQAHFALIEDAFDVRIVGHAQGVAISAADEAQAKSARVAIEFLLAEIANGRAPNEGDCRAAIRFAQEGGFGPGQALMVPGVKGKVIAKTPGQRAYIAALQNEHTPLVFGVGPAGTGKTYLAVAAAVSFLAARRVRRIVVTRPAVEAGERIGYLPGDIKDKLDPYLRPIWDALRQLMGQEALERRMAAGDIEIAPIGFMRGRTLAESYVIVDEAQNTTRLQMKMALTRLGEGSRMAVTGDPTQIDLPNAGDSGLADALRVLDGVEGVEAVAFTTADVVRHPLVGRIIDAYDKAQGRPSNE